MCGRIVQTTSPDEIAQWLGAIIDAPLRARGDWHPRWNLAPTADALLVAPTSEGLRVESSLWGLIPTWARDDQASKRLFNARAETVDRLPSFRDAFRDGRVIVPADAFYEWENPDHLAAQGIAVPKKSPKQPWAYLPTGGRPFAFAGISAMRPGEQGEAVRTFSLITTEANAVVARIHDRMPVMLIDEAARDAWLDPDTPIADLRALLGPAPDDALAPRRVSRAVSNARNEGPGLLDELPEAEALF